MAQAVAVRGEVHRHLLNCSDENDFNQLTEDLRNALQRRGYPSISLPCIPYDGVRRTAQIQKLHGRRKLLSSHQGGNKDKDGEQLLVFKCQFSPHLGKLKLHREVRRLLQHIRSELGRQFLDSPRLVIAHPVRANAFLDSYTYTSPREPRGRSGKKWVE